MSKLTTQELADLRTKHPRGIIVKELSDGSQWVFRKPTSDEWRECKGRLNVGLATGDNAAVATAHELLAQACCVAPGDKELQALRDEDPSIAGAFGEILYASVGTGRKIVGGKAEE